MPCIQGHSEKERTMRKLLAVSVLAGAIGLVGVAVAVAQKETRGVSKTEIVLGMQPDLSGPAATYGVSSSNAVKMRFDDVNEKGGIAGRKIKLIIEDTQYQIPRAVEAGVKVINRDHIFAMVASLVTPMNNALFKDQLEAGVPSLVAPSAASYALFVAAAQGGATEGLYAMGLTDMPYRDTLSPVAQAWFDRYKERYKVDPNIGAIYGHVAADLVVVALEKTGPELTLDNFVRA